MTRRFERTLWGTAVACTLLAVVGARYGGGVHTDVPAAPDVRPPEVLMFNQAALSAAADTAVAEDPFRLERRPAAVAFGDTITGRQARPAATPFRTIALRGVVGGPPWQAILSGAPGRTGDIVVRKGDTLAGLQVRRVVRDAITLAGPDSSVTLVLQHQWQ